MVQSEIVYYQHERLQIWPEADGSAFHVIVPIGDMRFHCVLSRGLYMAELDEAIRVATAPLQAAKAIPRIGAHVRPRKPGS